MASTHRRWGGVVVAAALVLGCESAAERAIGPAAPGSLTILFSADNQGVLSSCGCPSNPSGGLAKRQTIIDRYRRVRTDVVVVDAGDLFSERPNAQKVDYLGRALGRAAYDAIAVGDQEFGLGVARLRSLASEHHLPFLCANVRDASGELLFPAHVVREAGGRRIGIFAVVADAAYGYPPREWREGLTVEPPMEAARREVEALAGCDLVVALSHQPIEATRALAEQVPGIHVVVSGHGAAILREPQSVGGATVVATGPVGRVLGALTFGRGPDGAPAMAMQMTGLSERVPDSGWVMDLYWQYVRKAKGEAPPDWVLTPQPPVYESAEQCAKCHEKEHRQWLSTRHAHAYATIRRVGRHEDPECILCHTMGYGRARGFFSMEETPGLARVTCQACHPVSCPPGARMENFDEKSRPQRFINARLCINCHGLIQSPEFDYYAYRPKIAHGAMSAAKP